MINLGDKVEDTVSGYTGIAVVRHDFHYGNTSITVQPTVEMYGILPESECFYEDQLKVIKPKNKPVTILNLQK